MLVSDDVEWTPGPAVERRARVLYTNIRGLCKNLFEFAVAASEFDILVCAETKISDCRRRSEIHVRGLVLDALNRRLRNYTSAAQGLALHIWGRGDFKPLGRASMSICHESSMVRICEGSTIFVFVFYRNPRHDDSLHDYLLDSMSQVQLTVSKAVFAFVWYANVHHTEWLKSVSLNWWTWAWSSWLS